MSPLGRPSRGNSPGRAYPACTPFEAAFSSTPKRGESGVFWGQDHSADCLAAPASPSTPKRVGSCVCRSAQRSKSAALGDRLSPPRRNALVRAIPSSHDLGPRASGSGGSAASRHLGFRGSPTEQLSEDAFSSVPRHFGAGILFGLGSRTVHLTASGLLRCRGTSVRESPFSGGVGGRLLRGTEVLRIGFALPSGPETTTGFAVVRNAEDALERDFASGSDRPGPRCRLRRNASDSVFPSGRAFGPMPASSAVCRCAETHRFTTSPVDNTVEAAVPPCRSTTVWRFRRRALVPPSGWFVSATSDARWFASSTVGRSSGKPFKPGFPAASGLDFLRGAETLQIPTVPSAKPSEAASSAAPKRRRSGIPIRPSLQATYRFRRSPVREYASDPDSPPDLQPYGPSPPGSPCFGAEAPRWGQSFEQRPWSVVPFGGVVLLGAKTRWFPTSPSARAIRTATPNAGANANAETSACAETSGAGVPSSGAGQWVLGSTGLRVAVGDLAPKRLGFQPRRRHLPRGCAHQNRPRCRENPAVQSIRPRGPRVGLELCAAPQRRALPGTSSGRGPIGPFPDSSHGMRRVR
jgi:hypothetical protein